MQKLAMGLLRPLTWGIVALCLAFPLLAAPPIMYPDPPGSGGSGGGSGCTNDTSAAGCSHTYAATSYLQVWCGSQGWVTIKSQSCFYDATRNTACCTYQKQRCSYYDSSGVLQIQEETLANVQTCSTQ